MTTTVVYVLLILTCTQPDADTKTCTQKRQVFPVEAQCQDMMQRIGSALTADAMKPGTVMMMECRQGAATTTEGASK
jgi:hypothetical protein